ncbi:MAG: FAD-dependent oxidoreductase [Pigmentiphaga sp.]|nr:FAD-dependent oxidoreductase [Pigmentiphaga sp.]
MTTTELDTPILIAGGGPTGMALAIELGWRGVPCTVLEMGDGTVDHPRLGTILSRTMEFCRRWGIIDRVYNCGFNNDYGLNVVYCTSLAGHLLARDDVASCNEMPLPPQSPVRRQRCPQIWFNPLLEKAADEYDTVTIHHFSKLESFVDHGEYVEARVVDTRSGEMRTLRAKYLVGCDGASSVVRSSLDIPMQGNPVLSYSINIFIRCPGLVNLHDKGPAERYIFIGKDGTRGNLTVVDGRELWRITLIGTTTMPNLETFDAQAVVREFLGTDTIPFEIISVKPWRRTELTAQRFREGRVFLAGDAAHTMSPTGGHGMSTGMADAVDLGWKFEAVLKGWGGEALLDSYDLERRPIAALVAAASANNFHLLVSVPDCGAILDAGPEGEACREKVGKHMLKAGREDWDCLGLQLGYHYENSPICVPDGTAEPRVTVIEYHQTARPGSRAPHVWLPDGRSMLDLYGRGYTLLRFDETVEAQALLNGAESRGMPLKLVDLYQPAIAALYENRLVLVRPDGFVAWRGDALPEDPDTLLDVVTGVVAAHRDTLLTA